MGTTPVAFSHFCSLSEERLLFQKLSDVPAKSPRGLDSLPSLGYWGRIVSGTIFENMQV